MPATCQCGKIVDLGDRSNGKCHWGYGEMGGEEGDDDVV